MDIAESPLEKLKRLENGMSTGMLDNIYVLAVSHYDFCKKRCISVLEKPTEVETVEDEIVISELPSYDLPTQRQKTALEHYENQRKDSIPRQKEAMEEYPIEWEKLKKTPDESDDTVNPIILGKGKNPGKFIIHIAFDLVAYKSNHIFFFKADAIGEDLKLKILQNDKATEPEESLTLKPFDIPKFQETPLLKPDSKTKSELESKQSKHPKDLDEFTKNDKSKSDLEKPYNKTSTDKNTHHKPINKPTLDQEDAKTKTENLVIETKPGTVFFLFFFSVHLFILLGQ